jgi:hypothetical protein
MNPTEELIEATEKLLERVEPAFAAEQKVAALEKTAADLEAENTLLKTAKAQEEVKLRAGAVKAAAYFEECGLLKTASKETFIEQLVTKPDEIFGVVMKYAERLTVREVGGPTPTPAETLGLDPIAAFCAS